MPDFSTAGALVPVNRAATVTREPDRVVLTLDARSDAGIVWVHGVEFHNGVIEVHARGADLFQRSFLGIAFRGASDSAYDVVYFRPFNFRVADLARRAHGVQYASHPAHGWQALRTQFPGVYEMPVEPAPDPSDWFSIQLVVEQPTVRVHVNGSVAPALVIRELTKRTGGRVGLWVGENSGGSFARLRIRSDGRRSPKHGDR